MSKKQTKKKKKPVLSQSAIYIKDLESKGFRKRTFIIHNDDYQIVRELATGLRKRRLHGDMDTFDSEGGEIEI